MSPTTARPIASSPLKRAALALGLVAAALVPLGWWWNAEAPGPAYRTAQVDRGPIEAVVTATGTLNAVTTVQVGSQLSGMIARLEADYNAVVRRGMLLAEIDPRTFAATAAQARADVAAARGAVRVTEAELTVLDAEVAAARAGLGSARAAQNEKERALRRLRALSRERLVSEQDLDGATAASDVARATTAQAAARLDTAVAQRGAGDARLESARAQLAQKEAALELASVNLERTRILSPIDGVVVSRAVDVGQTVAASLQAPVLFTIANDLRRMQIDAAVDEADIGRVRVGQPVEFSVDAYPDERFDGTVVQVRLQPVVSQNVVTYDAVIQVANDELKLRPGMTANVSIRTARIGDALRLPNAALSYRPVGAESEALPRGVRLVYRLENGNPVAVRVRTGLSDAACTELTARTFAAGDRVVVGEAAAEASRNLTNPFAPRRR